MAEYKELTYFSGINSESDANDIIKEATELTMAAMDRDYIGSGLVSKFSVENYSEKNDSLRKAMLAYCGNRAGIPEITEKRHILNAFNNTTFESIYNAIVAETLLGVMSRTDSTALSIFSNIETVDVGGSCTFEIETKGLPIAQRNSYMSNTTFLEGVAKTSVTVTPKVYSTGAAIDVIRMLKGDVDMGKEFARVVMSLMYAQYQLAVSQIVNNTVITSTPLYRSSFTGANYILTISYLQALNNAGVRAYGTLPALNKLGVTATTSYGFVSQDEVLRTGFLGLAYGIPHIVLSQASNAAAAIGANDNTASNIMLLPTDKIFLLADVGDKPVKLVRENYIRVMNTTPNTNSINRREYQYFMSFDAAIATQAHFGIQAVS